MTDDSQVQVQIQTTDWWLMDESPSDWQTVWVWPDSYWWQWWWMHQGRRHGCTDLECACLHQGLRLQCDYLTVPDPHNSMTPTLSNDPDSLTVTIRWFTDLLIWFTDWFDWWYHAGNYWVLSHAAGMQTVVLMWIIRIQNCVSCDMCFQFPIVYFAVWSEVSILVSSS